MDFQQLTDVLSSSPAASALLSCPCSIRQPQCRSESRCCGSYNAEDMLRHAPTPGAASLHSAAMQAAGVDHMRTHLCPQVLSSGLHVWQRVSVRPCSCDVIMVARRCPFMLSAGMASDVSRLLSAVQCCAATGSNNRCVKLYMCLTNHRNPKKSSVLSHRPVCIAALGPGRLHVAAALHCAVGRDIGARKA